MLTKIQKGSNVYAVYDVSEKEMSPDNFTVMMINNNQKHDIGLAPITFEEMNGKYTGILFDVTGMITLREYIIRNTSQSEFRMMILNLVTTIEQFDEYMIDVQQVLLDAECVYINPVDFRVSFICVPIRSFENVGSLYSFFRMIVESCNVSSVNNEISYSERVRELTASEAGFSLKNLKNMMRPVPTESARPSEDASSASQPSENEDPVKVEEPTEITVMPRYAQPEYVEPVPMLPPEEKKKGLFGLFSSSSFSKKKPAKSNELSGGLAGLRMNGTPQPTPMPDAVPMPASAPVPMPGAVPMPTPTDQRQNKKKNAKINAKAAAKAEMNEETPPIPLSGGGLAGLRKQRQKGAAPQQPVIPQSVIPQPVISQQSSAPRAVLIRLKTNQIYRLEKPVSLIGREMEGVDVDLAGNARIGHRHASLILRGTGYYIKDLESKNHTYVNGLISQTGEETPLSDGDRIRFADEEFEFRVQ